MKPRIIAALVLGALASSLFMPASASDRGSRSRTEKVAYEAASGLALLGHGASTCLAGQDQATCVSVRTATNDRWLAVKIEDQSGEAVAGTVTQNGAFLAEFCGSTDKPIRVTPGPEVNISLYAGSCADGTPSVVTSGVLHATFSKKRSSAQQD